MCAQPYLGTVRGSVLGTSLLHLGALKGICQNFRDQLPVFRCQRLARRGALPVTHEIVVSLKVLGWPTEGRANQRTLLKRL